MNLVTVLYAGFLQRIVMTLTQIARIFPDMRTITIDLLTLAGFCGLVALNVAFVAGAENRDSVHALRLRRVSKRLA